MHIAWLMRTAASLGDTPSLTGSTKFIASMNPQSSPAGARKARGCPQPVSRFGCGYATPSHALVRGLGCIAPQYGPARADVLRYALMAKCGGVWLDIKSWWEKPEYHLQKFSPLRPLVLGGWGWANQAEEIPEDPFKRGEVQNWNLVSAPGHPVWDAVLKAVAANVQQELANQGSNQPPMTGKQNVLRLTGPIMLSRVLYPMLVGYPHLLLKNSSEFGFVYDRWGQHQKKQGRLGLNYSKLKKVPIVRDPKCRRSVLTLVSSSPLDGPYEVPRAVTQSSSSARG